MATAPLTFLPGESEEARAANKMYQDALKKMVESLDARKNRMFDPTLLAMAQGFLTPGRTGSFGEALGQVAGNVRAAEAEQAKEEQAAAAAELGIRQKQIEMMRQQAAQQYIMGVQPAGVSKPTGAPETAVQDTQVSQRAGDVPRQIVGQARAAPIPARGEPPSTNLSFPIFEGTGDPTEELRRAALLSPSVDPFKYQEAVAKARKDRYEKTEGGMYDLWTGAFIPAITGKMSTFNGVPLPESVVAQLAFLMRKGDLDAARRLFAQVSSGIKSEAELKGAEAGAQAAAQRGESVQEVKRYIPGYGDVELPLQDAYRYDAAVRQFGVNSPQAMALVAPRIGATMPAPETSAAIPQGAPSQAAPPPSGEGRPSAGAAVPSLQQREAERIRREEEAKVLAQESAKREATLPELYQNANTINENASRVLRSVEKSPQFFGIFERPTLTSALGKIVNEGISVPGGRLQLGGFEDAVRQAMPRATQAHLDNVKLAAADLAEMELSFAKMFMRSQGAITEGERKIVRAVPGTISTSPGVLRTRMELLRERSKFEMEDIDGYREFKKNNPQKSYLDWKGSDGYKQIFKKYEENSEQVYQDMLSRNAAQTTRTAPQRPTNVPPNYRLQQDANGNRAWVDPNNPKNYIEVK